jgi:hypothetical protein
MIYARPDVLRVRMSKVRTATWRPGDLGIAAGGGVIENEGRREGALNGSRGSDGDTPRAHDGPV